MKVEHIPDGSKFPYALVDSSGKIIKRAKRAHLVAMMEKPSRKQSTKK